MPERVRNRVSLLGPKDHETLLADLDKEGTALLHADHDTVTRHRSAAKV